MEQKTELTSLLKEASTILQKYNEDHWANWLKRDIELINANNHEGITHFLSAFGGMGSLNDLFIHPVNGSNISADESKVIMTKLHSIFDKSYEIAKDLENSNKNSHP